MDNTLALRSIAKCIHLKFIQCEQQKNSQVPTEMDCKSLCYLSTSPLSAKLEAYVVKRAFQ